MGRRTAEAEGDDDCSCILHKMKLFGLFREACEKTIAVVNPAADKGMNEFF